MEFNVNSPGLPSRSRFVSYVNVVHLIIRGSLAHFQLNGILKINVIDVIPVLFTLLSNVMSTKQILEPESGIICDVWHVVVPEPTCLITHQSLSVSFFMGKKQYVCIALLNSLHWP